jgi:methylmalonyl-CoA mutase N-terminal domain/subunit
MGELTEEEYQEWKEKQYDPLVDNYGERKEEFSNSSGMEIPPVYTNRDWSDEDYDEDLGMPGEYPFTRGVQPNMYRGKLWTMRQYAGFGTAEESNERYHYLLEQGNKGLSVAFDLPTQIGMDSDDPLAQGEVGKVGVAIDTLRDMEILFDGIPLDDVSTSMTINASASVLLCLYVAVAKQQDADLDELRGTIQNDVLKEYMARGTYIYPPEPSLRIISDIFEWCSEELPSWNTISVSGYHIREAGCTAAQEIAFTLADGMEYVRAGMDAGLDVDDFAPQLSFFFNAHNNFLEEIAKFRAARRLWARIMKNEFNAQDPKSCRLKFHAQTGGSTLTAQQVENNVARVTIQAMAAVLGGCQSLHTNGKDEALSLPTEQSVRTALRTQQIIAHESGVADAVDPLGGSYLIEDWTNQLEELARDYIDEIEEMGGMVEAIDQGYPQKQISDAAYEHQQAVEEEEEIVVGVNKFQVEEEEDPEMMKLDPKSEDRQVERLNRVREERDSEAVEKRLDELRDAAKSDDENLIPHILRSVEAYASIGEIIDAMKEEFGEYQQSTF